jgi:hypothetical protein
LIYKWDHSRGIIAKVLTDKYSDMIQTGRRLTSDELKRDVRLLLEGNFTDFLAR